MQKFVSLFGRETPGKVHLVTHNGTVSRKQAPRLAGGASRELQRVHGSPKAAIRQLCT